VERTVGERKRVRVSRRPTQFAVFLVLTRFIASSDSFSVLMFCRGNHYRSNPYTLTQATDNPMSGDFGNLCLSVGAPKPPGMCQVGTARAAKLFAQFPSRNALNEHETSACKLNRVLIN
jgi:hypothetical protein